MSRRRFFHTTAGLVILAAAIVVPAGPAAADAIRSQLWYLDSLKVLQAHTIATGGGVTVGLIDSGVDQHPDVTRNLLPGVDELTGKADARSDKVGHGTQMAGLIAAHGRGSSGVLGIAPSAKVMPIKISNSADRVSGALLAKGIKYATDHKTQVINVSAAVGPEFELIDAVKDAQAANVVIVAGTGNVGGGLVSYPAAAEGVLAVGATDRDGKPARFSTAGHQVQVCAPGVNIETIWPGDGYVRGTGTSVATAIVSGAVALVRAKFPQLPAAEVIHRITATADDIGPPGRDDQCGFGELNIVKALTADVPPLTGPSGSASPSASAGMPSADVTTGSAAPPTTEDRSSSGPLVVGVVVVVLVVAGLVGFVAVRRRRS